MTGLAIAQAIHFVERQGYALVFLWVLAEEAALPIPSVPLLIAVGALVRLGRMNGAAAIACCIAGALIADSIWFHLGRLRGKRILRFLCRISLEPDSCVRHTEKAFLKYGLKTLLIAKFVPGLSTVTAPLSGDSGVSAVRFLALDYIQRLGSWFVVLMVGLLAAWILWKFIQRRRFFKQIKMARITPEELRDRVEAGEEVCILDLRTGDLRTRAAGDSSSFPSVFRVSVEDLAANSEQIPRDREIILFCSCPNEASSARAALLLKSRGFTKVRPLRGGADAWEEMMQLRLNNS